MHVSPLQAARHLTADLLLLQVHRHLHVGGVGGTPAQNGSGMVKRAAACASRIVMAISLCTLATHLAVVSTAGGRALANPEAQDPVTALHLHHGHLPLHRSPAHHEVRTSAAYATGGMHGDSTGDGAGARVHGSPDPAVLHLRAHGHTPLQQDGLHTHERGGVTTMARGVYSGAAALLLREHDFIEAGYVTGEATGAFRIRNLLHGCHFKWCVSDS